MLIQLGPLGAIYLDPQGYANAPRSPWFDAWVSGGERIIRLGRLELIHTPRNWRERRAAERRAAES